MADKRNEHPLVFMSAAERRAMQQAQLSRRRFLAQSGVFPAAVAAGVAVNPTLGAASQGLPSGTAEVPGDWPEFPGVPETPMTTPPDQFQALTADEAAVVEALTARLLPGTPEDPGAREAGVVYYIDYLLSQNEGFVEWVYRAGPFARGYEGDEEPEPEEGVVWVKADELLRYGYQAAFTPLSTYQIGVAAIEEYANEEFGGGYVDLSEEDQDQVIWAMLEDSIPQFEAFSAVAFFHTLRLHTVEGMFSDPGYGGNRNLAGWRLVGFPGSQRAYDPIELQTEQEPREPMTMHDLPEFNPGRTEDGPILPVRGTDPGDDTN
jgi:gluconate 2-dehydrogenase gamma chain